MASTPVRAVAVVHPAAAACLALIVHARLLAGETVYVAGGAGHVGSAAVLLAVRAKTSQEPLTCSRPEAASS